MDHSSSGGSKRAISSIDLSAKRPKLHFENQKKKLIIVLENAQLESAKVGKDFELLNCDKHARFLKKHNRDPADFRPDITHQCLLMLMDSPLNREGLLQVYIHTAKNVLIEINPKTRIPRTFDRFCGLMVQLLHKLNIRANDSSEKLLKVIKNPIDSHLPIGCTKLGTSFHSSEGTHPRELVPEDGPIVLVIGAMARGKVNVGYIEKEVKLSDYPLSAALTCCKVCTAFEETWNIF